ncbi:hypothetical protein SAMN02982994_0949 [Azospirillum lipoferum]|nr:hypothetical protein SAMN02982994_0949 [Azospirillum lipoferum]
MAGVAVRHQAAGRAGDDQMAVGRLVAAPPHDEVRDDAPVGLAEQRVAGQRAGQGALVADHRVGDRRARLVGEVGIAVVVAQAEPGEEAVDQRQRHRLPAGRDADPRLAQNGEAHAVPHRRRRPVDEGGGVGERLPGEPGHHPAQSRIAGQVGQAIGDVPVDHRQPEMVERHLGHGMHPRQADRPLLAQVDQGQHGARHRRPGRPRGSPGGGQQERHAHGTQQRRHGGGSATSRSSSTTDT